jgi:hypothetical protein
MPKASGAKSELPDEEEVHKHLAAAPLVDVLGVLSASGVGGSWCPGETRWTMVFTFASWRVIGRDLQRRDLIVRRKVRKGEIDKYRNLVQSDVVTRIRAHVAEQSLWGRPEALLHKVIGPDTSDPEMTAEIVRLKKPIRFRDRDFGVFTLDRTINWFNTHTKWNGRRIQLQLAACKPKDVERALDVARKLWSAQKRWQAKVLSCAVKQLLPVKNATWLGAAGTKITSTQFKKRMKLQSITVRPNGEIDFWHNDGDLFFGHNIEVTGWITKGLRSANIHG